MGTCAISGCSKKALFSIVFRKKYVKVCQDHAKLNGM